MSNLSRFSNPEDVTSESELISKLSLDINSDSEVTSSGFENLDKLDIDLIDKIKLAIAKLKTINKEHCPQKRKFAKDPCSIC